MVFSLPVEVVIFVAFTTGLALCELAVRATGYIFSRKVEDFLGE